MSKRNLNHLDIGRAISRFFNIPAEVIARAFEITGCALNDSLILVGQKLKVKPLFQWLGGIVKGGFSVISAIIKAVFGIAAGLISGPVLIVLGILSGTANTIYTGFSDLLFPAVGSIIVVIGKAIAHIQSTIYLQGFERPLTESEKALLKDVFHSSVNLYLIRIIEHHSGIFDLTPRAFTLGNTLYLKKSEFDEDLLVHEATHSWQYQHLGNRYTIDALSAQWFVDDAYNWRKEIEDRGKSRWQDLNMESQAGFIEFLWLWGQLVDKNGNVIESGNGSFFNEDGITSKGEFYAFGRSFTSIANKALQIIRKQLI